MRCSPPKWLVEPTHSANPANRTRQFSITRVSRGLSVISAGLDEEMASFSDAHAGGTIGVSHAAKILKAEGDALCAAAAKVDHAAYLRASELLRSARGPIITTGVGTSGIIARKLAATLTSTGTRAVFMHPSDAMHGQLGLLDDNDVVVALSNSGETEEILALVPNLSARHVAIIAIVGTTTSTLATRATVVLAATVPLEAGPLSLAPTSSTTLALGVADALAMQVTVEQGLTPERFARNHPSGRLGRRLTLLVRDIMRPASKEVMVSQQASALEVLSAISSGMFGGAMVVDEGARLEGFITDGDVRRALEHGGPDAWASLTAGNLMTASPQTTSPEIFAFAALQSMETRLTPVTALPVVDSRGEVAGVLSLHDLIRAGL